MGTAYLPAPLHVVAYNFFSIVVPKSEQMFFLDVKPEEAVSRIAGNRTEIERFESLESLREIRVVALALTRFDKWKIINSNRAIGEVSEELKKKIWL
jgi:dTMP kinase